MEEKRSGEFVGAFPSYGYIKNPEDNHKLIIDKESAEIVRKIFEWKVNEGLGNLSICHRLNDMGVLNPTGYKKKKLNQNYNNSQIMQEDYSCIKLHIELLVDTEKILEQINKSNTKKLANENMDNIKKSKRKGDRKNK